MRKKTREFIHKLIDQSPLDTLTHPEGFEEAIIGVGKTGRVIMSEELCIRILCDQIIKERNEGDDDNDMDPWEEAADEFYYNTKGAYIGKLTPIWKK